MVRGGNGCGPGRCCLSFAQKLPRGPATCTVLNGHMSEGDGNPTASPTPECEAGNKWTAPGSRHPTASLLHHFSFLCSEAFLLSERQLGNGMVAGVCPRLGGLGSTTALHARREGPRVCRRPGRSVCLTKDAAPGLAGLGGFRNTSFTASHRRILTW